jgi:dCMP deaminase
MTDVAIAYIPVLHEGYRRFAEAHARDKPLWLIGPSLYADYRPLAKDIRALDAESAAAAIAAWGICSEVGVLDEAAATSLAASSPSIVLPDEDVSYQVVERFFARCPVVYETAFLRWDKSKSVRLLKPGAARQVGAGEAWQELAAAAEGEAARSVDWWRQVGAALRLRDGEILSATNVHSPHPLAPYAAGDPRSNFFKGVHIEISTVTHAEAALVAEAALRGLSTDGGAIYVTDFPCPPCAKLIAGAGIATLYFREGYAMLDGEDVLAAAGVEVVQVT